MPSPAFLAIQSLQFADVKVIATKSALYFVQEADLPLACRPLLGALRRAGYGGQVAGYSFNCPPELCSCPLALCTLHDALLLRDWHTACPPPLRPVLRRRRRRVAAVAGCGRPCGAHRAAALGGRVCHCATLRWGLGSGTLDGLACTLAGPSQPAGLFSPPACCPALSVPCYCSPAHSLVCTLSLSACRSQHAGQGGQRLVRQLGYLRRQVQLTGRLWVLRGQEEGRRSSTCGAASMVRHATAAAPNRGP